MQFFLTSADKDVALEMDPVALGKLEHGEDLGLGAPVVLVVGELGDDVLVRTSEKKAALGFTVCSEKWEY